MEPMGPIRLTPLLKRIRWGGRRLETVLGKSIGIESDYAESWEVSDHGSDQSIVAAGPLAGAALTDLVRQSGVQLLGRDADRTQFPLLIKFLDAQDRLSVQVHPDDRLARDFDPTENGKTEAWIILDALPGSRLFAGLKPDVDPDALRAAIAANRVEDCLHSFEVHPGDCVFVPAGTVHAIGEGVLLAEVQQSSDLTFRLYDWGRTGSDGKPRELHIGPALLCTDFTRGPVNCVEPRPLDDGSEELVRCEHFVIRRIRQAGTFTVPDDNRFHVLMCLGGEIAVACVPDLELLTLGQTLLLPASRSPATVHLKDGAVVLDVWLP